MKNRIAMMLAMLAMILMIGNALAYDGDITFQGIPWGTSCREMIETLYENEFLTSELVTAGQITMEQLIEMIEPSMINMETTLVVNKKGKLDLKWPTNAEGEYVNNLFSSGELQYISTIGGYPVTGIEPVFAGSGESSKLIQVRVRLAGDSKEQYDDLSKKLTSVYGKSVTGKIDNQFKYVGWIGKDGKTGILLANVAGLYFYYACLEGEVYLQEAVSQIPTPVPVDQNDVGGL